MGDTIEAVRNRVDRVYSVELDRERAKHAARRFRHAANVEIIHGDSATELPRLLPALVGERCLFWLDGHSSTSTPILAELETILPFEYSRIVLIDDAREFDSNEHYPSLDAVHDCAKRYRFSIQNRDDIVRLIPQT